MQGTYRYAEQPAQPSYEHGQESVLEEIHDAVVHEGGDVDGRPRVQSKLSKAQEHRDLCAEPSAVMNASNST